MRLGALLDGLGAVAVEGNPHVDGTGVAADSRRVTLDEAVIRAGRLPSVTHVGHEAREEA